jgi:dTMP kinase
MYKIKAKLGSSMKKGLFITLEGIDGCGKSTLAANLAQHLQAAGHAVLLTKEPGGSRLGVDVRKILHEQPEPLEPTSEFLLFAADRAEHFAKVIRPALAQGKIVISDRCADSSLAYQGYARGLNIAFIQLVNTVAMNGIAPSCTLFIRLDPVVAFARLENRGNGKLTAIEERGTEFMHKAQAGFEEIFQPRSNVIYLDGTQSQDQLLIAAVAGIQTYMAAQ